MNASLIASTSVPAHTTLPNVIQVLYTTAEQITKELHRPSVPVGRRPLDYALNHSKNHLRNTEISNALRWLLATGVILRTMIDEEPKFWLACRQKELDQDAGGGSARYVWHTAIRDENTTWQVIQPKNHDHGHDRDTRANDLAHEVVRNIATGGTSMLSSPSTVSGTDVAVAVASVKVDRSGINAPITALTLTSEKVDLQLLNCLTNLRRPVLVSEVIRAFTDLGLQRNMVAMRLAYVTTRQGLAQYYRPALSVVNITDATHRSAVDLYVSVFVPGDDLLLTQVHIPSLTKPKKPKPVVGLHLPDVGDIADDGVQDYGDPDGEVNEDLEPETEVGETLTTHNVVVDDPNTEYMLCSDGSLIVSLQGATILQLSGAAAHNLYKFLNITRPANLGVFNVDTQGLI